MTQTFKIGDEVRWKEFVICNLPIEHGISENLRRSRRIVEVREVTIHWKYLRDGAVESITEYRVEPPVDDSGLYDWQSASVLEYVNEAQEGEDVESLEYVRRAQASRSIAFPCEGDDG